MKQVASLDETQYHSDVIQRIFEHIEEDGISPQERARMFAGDCEVNE